jgi:glycine/D-amino acid oxidase-like deaminating enzyme
VSSAIVIGAGVFGASLAHRLAGEGWEVTLVERERPGHPAASSGGESRIIRCSHGGDRWYTRSARRALSLWREIEAEAGVELLVECGVAWFARAETGWESESEAALRAEHIPVERCDPSSLFPDLRGGDLAFTLLEPEAGLLRAALATRTLAELARARGARLVRAEARPAGAAVALGGGEVLEADRVVWACGPWLGALFPELVELRVTRQEVTFFAAAPEWAAGRVPAWVDYDGSFYGTGALDGHGAKVAPDAEGPPFDPDRGSREPGPEAEREARAYLEGRFPALARAPLSGATVCQYELTADTHFVCAPHAEHPDVWLLGGGSGHGFKHGPALAERVASQLRGEEQPDPRFALGARRRDRSLRTAGLRAAAPAAATAPAPPRTRPCPGP